LPVAALLETALAVSFAEGTTRSLSANSLRGVLFVNDGGLVPEQIEATAYPDVGSLREVLQRTLDKYLTVKLEPQGGHPFNKWFRRLPSALKRIIPNVSDLRIDYGGGHGSNWSNIPYIAFRRVDIAPSTQYGVFPAYFFSGDMSAVYLSLNQGPANALNAKPDKAARLREISIRYAEE